MARKTIFPVTRVHEPLRADVEIQGGRVADSWVSGQLFRGWEPMMKGRDVRDAALFTQRICGICSVAHAVAETIALQHATGLAPTVNGQLLTNFILSADTMQNHLRHFYLLTLFDYVLPPDSPPWTPRPKGDYRLPKKASDALVQHVPVALRVAAQAHELAAMWGAKAPHQQTIMLTGVTQQPTAENIKASLALLREIRYFVQEVYLPDVLTVAEYYQDYYEIGKTAGNVISFGMFPDPATGQRAFPAGASTGQGPVEPLNADKISEDVSHSWYRDNSGGSPAVEVTDPDPDRPGAYSWIKAPRYNGLPFEGGPLARAWVSGDYRRGTGVMDRLVARSRETLKICLLAETWLARVIPGQPGLRPYSLPPQGEGVGLTDVMRGSLGHWVRYRDGKIEHHQIITPTAWKFSPRDTAGQRGPVEQALIGTPVADPDNLIEVGRVIRSFDPCLTCAVHVVDAPGAKPLIL